MKNKTTLAWMLALPLAASTLQGCFPIVAAGAGTAVVSSIDRRTSGTQLEDEGIELRSNNRISERYGDKAHVNVTSYNRAVLLSGEVPDAAAKAEVEKIVRGVPNVRGVTNDLVVAGPSALGARSNDAIVTSKVKARFVDAGKFNPVHVKVVTESAVVYLFGIVTEREAADATEIARTTGGVRKVVRLFEFCRPTDEACRPPETPKGDAPKAKSTP
jgi:osmotically-inducible protein OsmY